MDPEYENASAFDYEDRERVHSDREIRADSWCPVRYSGSVLGKSLLAIRARRMGCPCPGLEGEE